MGKSRTLQEIFKDFEQQTIIYKINTHSIFCELEKVIDELQYKVDELEDRLWIQNFEIKDKDIEIENLRNELNGLRD